MHKNNEKIFYLLIFHTLFPSVNKPNIQGRSEKEKYKCTGPPIINNIYTRRKFPLLFFVINFPNFIYLIILTKVDGIGLLGTRYYQVINAHMRGQRSCIIDDLSYIGGGKWLIALVYFFSGFFIAFKPYYTKLGFCSTRMNSRYFYPVLQ